MVRLRRSDLESLLAARKLLREAHTIDVFEWTAMEVVRQLIGGISYSYTVMDLANSRSYGAMYPPDSAPSPGMIDALVRYASQHPLIVPPTATFDGTARKISDHIDSRAFRRLELYADFYRQRDTEDQMVIHLPDGSDRVIGLTINRDRRTFTEWDRGMLNAIRPYLMESHRNAAAHARFVEEPHTSNLYAVWIANNGRIAQMTPGADRLLREYWRDDHRHGNQLPESLYDWVLVQVRPSLSTDYGLIPRPLSVHGREGWLSVRYLAGPLGESNLLLFEEHRHAPVDGMLTSLGLTPREEEVVRLVIQGKTSGEIGGVLGIQRRTVEAHLAHIYERLGVSTRAALVARVMNSAPD